MSHRMIFRQLALALVFCLPAVPVMAAGQDGASDPNIDSNIISAGFLAHHPDLLYRQRGSDAYQAEQHAEAMGYFRRAALYADKPSQAMIAEMLWQGEGGPADRAQAYAWMDLAAERGYRVFLAKRERYWNTLDAAERERALVEGQAVYARYGDAAAKPRIARVLRRGRQQTTGSRTGFVGNLKILVPGPNGGMLIDGSRYYDPRYWDPEQYAAWHDEIWMKPAPGRVDVGEVEALREQAPPSRIPATASEGDADVPEVPDEPLP